jgi:hypothetical protein
MVDLRTELDEVEWQEEFRLPSAPKTWGANSGDAPSITNDGRTSIMQKRVKVHDGRIFNVWRVAPGDPTGDYSIRLVIADLQPIVFKFTAAPLSALNALPVAPGQQFPGRILSIRAPDSAGWKLTSLTPAGMQFFRSGASDGETYVAMVRFFLLPTAQGQDGLLEIVKDSFEKHISPPRFEIIESSFESTRERDYACIRTVANVQDKSAFFGRAVLLLQWHSLTCRHPVRQDAGFEISYSHRGPEPDKQSEEEARAFIAGVQVPDN